MVDRLFKAEINIQGLFGSEGRDSSLHRIYLPERRLASHDDIRPRHPIRCPLLVTPLQTSRYRAQIVNGITIGNHSQDDWVSHIATADFFANTTPANPPACRPSSLRKTIYRQGRPSDRSLQGVLRQHLIWAQVHQVNTAYCSRSSAPQFRHAEHQEHRHYKAQQVPAA